MRLQPTLHIVRRGPLIALLIAACSSTSTQQFQGYAEAEYVRIAVPFAGNLNLLAVRRGIEVKAGAPLFTLEQENEAQAKREAAERLRQAQARLDDLKKSKRPSEIAAIQAQLAQAEAALKLSETQFRRYEKLSTEGIVSREKLDEARTAYERDQAKVQELSAQAETARLSGRQDEIRAAAAEVEAARAALAQADWRLAQKAVKSPLDGLITETLFNQGEGVPAGSPVISLLPPQNIKVRFFVPETVVGALSTGQAVLVTCDGCKDRLTAKISYISPQAEYTPPVIYSKENRNKLVFLVEAFPSPEDAVKLHPGQPVDVQLKQP
jgi:HlyD family secretion protein